MSEDKNMSEADRERILGHALLEYSEAKKALALFRNEFQQLGDILQSVAESLRPGEKRSFERALLLVSSNPMKLVDAEKLRQSLVEFRETEIRFQASQKNLQQMGIAID